MEDSILNTIKQMLGVETDSEDFDTDIIVWINSAFSILSEVGVVPSSGYRIESSDNTWDEVLGDALNFEDVKSFVYLKARTMFNPPSTSFALQAMSTELEELAWRIKVKGGEDDE